MKGKSTRKPTPIPREDIARPILWRLLSLFVVVAPVSYEFRSVPGIRDGIATAVIVSVITFQLASWRQLAGPMNLALVYGAVAGLLLGIFGGAGLFFFMATTTTQVIREAAAVLAAGLAWGLAKGVFSDDPRVPARQEWTKDLWAALFASPFIGATFAAASIWRGASVWLGLATGALVVVGFEGGLFFGRWLSLPLGPWIRAFRDVWRYLRAMGPPLGSFVLGYVALGVLFAGFYGAAWRYHPSWFAGDQMPSNPSFGDFCYFSVVTLATLGYGDITPACNSPVVKTLVCVEVALGIGWTTVVLGAVMALLQPVFSEIVAAARHQNPSGNP